MIVAALFLGGLAGTVHADSLHVRAAGSDSAIAVVASAAGPALRAASVLPLVGVRVGSAGPGRFTLSHGDVTITVVDGAPFASVRGKSFPLVAPPTLRDGALLIPLSTLGDLLERFGGDIVWDGERRELRLVRGRPLVATTTRASAPPVQDFPPPAEWPAAPLPASRPITLPPARRTASHLVVVDAGHGGPDNGMHGSLGSHGTLYEKDVTLAVAKKLSAALQERGLGVVMTRSTDTLIALADRGRIANRSKGDLFISIHVNAANPHWKTPGSARGFETYFLSDAKTEDERRVARMENESVRFDGDVDLGKGDPLNFLLTDMLQNEHLRESSDLASVIQAHLARMHPGPSRGVKQAGFMVLVTSFMPSVLVEIGFGTNAAEAVFIASPDGQRRIASAVADAAVEYLAHYDRRTGATVSSGHQ